MEKFFANFLVLMSQFTVYLPCEKLLLSFILLGFSGGSDSKESTYSVGDLGLSPELGRSPGGGHGNPLQYTCLENPHGQRSLVGYSPWVAELDRTEVTGQSVLEFPHHYHTLTNISIFILLLLEEYGMYVVFGSLPYRDMK